MINDLSSAAFELYAIDGEMALEELPDGNALGSFSSLTSGGSFSCPASSASSLTSASSASG
jgi:hypothetical protein